MRKPPLSPAVPNPRRTIRRILTGSIAAVAALAAQSGQAQTWNGGGADDNWGTPGNWVGGVAPSTGTGTTVNFGGSTRLTPFFNYTPYDQMGSIFFNSGAGAFTLNGNSIKIFSKIENTSTVLQIVSFANLVLNGTTATEINPVNGDLLITSPVILDTPELRVYGNNGKTVTFSGAIANGSLNGSFALLQNSTAVFTAANTYSGDTYVSAGKLQFAQGGSANNSIIRLGDTSGAVDAEVSIIDADGGTTSSSLLVVRAGSSGVKTISATNTSGTNTFSGNVALDADATAVSSTLGGTLAFTGGVFDLKNQTLTVSGAGAMTIGGVLQQTTGSGKLTKTGNGTLTLSGANTYTGLTTISGGVISIAANNNLGTGAVTLNGGTLATTAGFTNTHAITIGASGGTINVSSSGQIIFNTANTLLGSNSLTVTGSSGTLAGQSTLAGNLRVLSTNTYSGNLTVQSGGIFEHGIAGAVAAGATFTIGNEGEVVSPVLTVPNAITVSGGTNSVLSFANGTSGNFSGLITLNANATVGLRDFYNYATVRGGTISGQVTGVGGLTVNSGTGTGGRLILSNAANNYGGTTTVTSSILQANDGASLPAGSFLSLDGGVLLSNGAVSFTRSLGTSGNTFQLTANGGGFSANGGQLTVNLGGAAAGQTWGSTVGSQLVGTLQFGSVTANAKTLFQNGIDLNGANRTINVVAGVGGDSAEVSGGLTNSTGSAGLTVGTTGTGVLILSGTNTFDGPVTLTSGTLSVAATTNLGGATANNDVVFNGGTLQVTGTAFTNFGSHTPIFNATKTVGFDINTAANVFTVSQVLNQTTGGLLKAGAGTLALTSTNTFTGTVTMNAGTLSLSSTGDLVLGNATAINGVGGTISGSSTGKVLINAGTFGNGLDIGASGTLTISAIIANGTAGNIDIFGGAGTTVFSGANTYTGQTAIQQGTLSVGSLNTVAGGTASSNLGAPVTVANGTIKLGSLALTAGLKYTGTTAETTDRVIDLAGTTGSVTLDQSGTAALKFSSALTATGAGSKTLTLLGSTTGTGELAGAIVNNSGTNTTGIAKTGTGTWILSNTGSTYSGATAITGGTLRGTNSHAFGDTTGISIGGSSTLDLRGDTSATYGKTTGGAAYTTNITATGAAINVDRNTVAGTGQTFTLGAMTISSTAAAVTTTFTGGNNTSLVLGTVTDTTATSGTETFTNNISGGGSLTLGGFTGTRITSPLLTFNGSGNTTVSGVIQNSAGTQALTYSGTGILTLGGTNTYTGVTNVSAGAILAITNGSALGTVAGNTVVASGGVLRLSNNITTLAEPLTIAGGGINNGGALEGFSGTNTYAGPITFTNATRIDVDSGSTLNLTAATSVTGAFNFVSGGQGNLNVQGIIANSTGMLNKDGTGTMTLTGANTYTGLTTANGGFLLLGNGGSLAATAVTVNATGAFGVKQNANATTNAMTGTLTLASNSAFTMADTFTSTLNVTGATVLAPASGVNVFAPTLTFDVNATTVADKLNVTGIVSAGTAGARLAINSLGGVPAGPYNIITGGAGSSLLTNVTLANTKLSVGGTAYTLSLAGATPSTATNIFVTATASAQLDAAYWKGTTSAVWNGATTNWTKDLGGTVPTGALPTALTDVFFTATGATNLNNTLGADTTISSLNFTSAASAVNIGAGNTLTLNASGFGNVGLSSASGSAAQTVNAPIVLGGQQVWNNNSTNLLTVGGAVTNGGFLLTTGGAGNITIGGNLTGTGGLTKTGTGTLTLTGTDAITGNGTLNVVQGVVNIPSGSFTAPNLITVGNTAYTNAVMNISGGSVTTTVNANPAFVIGGGTSSIASAGSVTVSGSGSLSVNGGTAAQLVVGQGSGSYAGLNVSGTGAVTTGSFLVLGFNNDRSVLNQSGGTITINTNVMTIAAGGTGSVAVANLSGGTFNASTVATGGIFVGELGIGVLNASGATINLGTGANGLTLGRTGASSSGTVNLSGGNINTIKVIKGVGTANFNFNGGTLTATAATGATFFTGLTSTYIQSGGATIDTASFNNTVGQALLAPTGNGVSATGLTVSGGGFINTPLVSITGGGGSGATANATIDANGNLTGIVMTNPGVGYTSAPIFTLVNTNQSAGNLVAGGFGNTGAIGGTATLVANNSTPGGLTVKGSSGILTLSGANTYTGATDVQSGTAQLTGSLSTATSLNLGNGVNSGKFILGSTAAAVNQTVSGLTTSGTGTTNALVGGFTTNSTLTVNFASGTNTYAGALGGAGTNENFLALTKSGAGTLVLSGTGTYTGNTTVNNNGGVLQIASVTALPSGSTISNPKAGLGTGTLQINVAGTNTFANAFANFSSSNNLSNGGTANIQNLQGNNTFSGNMNIASGGGNGVNLQSDAGLLTISGTLVNTVSASNRPFDFGGAGNGVFSGQINNGVPTGAVTGIVKDGAGTWSLTGTNSNTTGGVSINAGILNVASVANTGTNSSIGAGGSIVLSGQGTSGTLQYTGATAQSTDHAVQVAATGGTIEASGSAGGSLSFTGTVTGTDPLGFGLIYTVGNNVATNTVSNAPGIAVGMPVAATGLPAGTTITAISGNQYMLSNNFTGTSGSVSTTFSTIDRILTLTGTNTDSNSITGVIADSAGGGKVGITKSGTGTWALGGANTYTGPTTITAGSLQLGTGGATGSLATGGLITNNGNLTINRSDAVVQGTDFSGSAITGTGSLTQAGSGTTTLNAANSYTGGTTLSAGTLVAGHDSALGSTAAQTVTFNGGKLASDNDARALTNNVVVNNVAGNQITGSNSLTLSGNASGAGTLQVNLPGAESVTLATATTDGFAPAALNVTGGTLLLGGADKIGNTTALTLGGGTFNTGGFSETLGTLTLIDDSIIDFGSGASTLSFADSTGLWTSGKTLNVWNWSGTPSTGGGTDQLRFASNGLDANQLGQINFFSGAGVGQISITPTFAGNGFVSFGEVVPVPEPSSVATVMGLLGLVGWRERRKARVTLQAGRRSVV